ncbi:hypothetical protein B0H13DRAFT_1997283 [Mycena leptocephala]|nr:hypothetical protein B0H13DRAFT_1997283 [Mycena leptocephala]
MPATLHLPKILQRLSSLLRNKHSRTWLWLQSLFFWLIGVMRNRSSPSSDSATDADHRARSAEAIYPPRESFLLASQDSGLNFTAAITQANAFKDDTAPKQLLSSIPGIVPSSPEHFKRYERGETIEKTPTTHMIKPQQRPFLRTLRDGWTAHVHPEGALYYVHDEKRIFTDAHLHKDDIFAIAKPFLDKIEPLHTGKSTSRNSDVDLVLDFVRDNEGKYSCHYYFAEHNRRVVFWDHPFEFTSLSRGKEVDGVTSPQHIETELTAQFWRHCDLFPCAISLTPALIVELRDILLHNIVDAMISPTSTVQYPVDYLLKMLTVTESLKENVGTDHGGSVCVLGRLMWTFTSHKFYNFHGEPCARLDKTQSVYGSVPSRSLLIRVIALLLFNAPLMHLRTLEDAHTDGIVSHVTWRRITEVLDQEWQELTLFATVLLNADMAFLAIPTVEVGVNTSRSTAQIASYVSAVASLGSIIVGLILARQNRNRCDANIDEAADYLARHSDSLFGFQPLAILYSLPFALLMWGTLAFVVAFLDMCFQMSDKVTRGLVGSIYFLAFLGIIWCFDQGRRSSLGSGSGLVQWMVGKMPRASSSGKRADHNGETPTNSAGIV